MSAEQAPLQMPPAQQMRPMGPLIIPERKEFVPEWCPWRNVTEAAWRGDEEAFSHMAATRVWAGSESDREYIVSNGVAVTVAHVLPERRWAIESNGRIKDTHLYEQQIQMKWIETFAIAGERQSGDPNLIPKPNPREFVKWGEDPKDRSKRLPIGYDPLKPAPANVRLRTEADAEADPVAELRPGLVARPEGVMSPKNQLIEERLGLLERLVKAGGISDEERAAAARRIAEGAGWATPSDSGGSREPEVSKASPSFGPASSASDSTSPLVVKTAQCGRVFEKATEQRAAQALRMHARKCRECIGTDEATGA